MSDPAPQYWRPPDDAPDQDDADVQKVFDTVVGPNMRLSDNLIQFLAIVAGTAVGAGAGVVYARNTGGDHATGAIVGGFAGLLASLLLSGLVIGVVRAIMAVRR